MLWLSSQWVRTRGAGPVSVCVRVCVWVDGCCVRRQWEGAQRVLSPAMVELQLLSVSVFLFPRGSVTLHPTIPHLSLSLPPSLALSLSLSPLPHTSLSLALPHPFPPSLILGHIQRCVKSVHATPFLQSRCHCMGHGMCG